MYGPDETTDAFRGYWDAEALLIASHQSAEFDKGWRHRCDEIEEPDHA